MTDDATSPLQQLLDIEQIKQLKARYFRLMDTKQWDDWGMVFATDCVMEVPEAEMVNNGREEIVTTVSTALDRCPHRAPRPHARDRDHR